jgi:hypothetical protein
MEIIRILPCLHRYILGFTWVSFADATALGKADSHGRVVCNTRVQSVQLKRADGRICIWGACNCKPAGSCES